VCYKKSINEGALMKLIVLSYVEYEAKRKKIEYFSMSYTWNKQCERFMLFIKTAKGFNKERE